MCLECFPMSSSQKLSMEIEKRLKQDKLMARKEVKLLLLGTGESGKSTFMKQMRIIHDGGFNVKELQFQRKYIFHNTIVCMQTILTEMTILGIPFECEKSKAYAERILSLYVTYENVGRIFSGDHLPPELVECIESLWKDRGVQSAFERRTEYKLSDSAEYFFSNVGRYGVPDYLPTDQDMLRIRLPTTGITEHCFQIKKIWLRIVDVGGQQSERRKWIHCFDCVKSIIFLTALNEYDMYFEHDHQHSGKTRLQESLDLFKLISQIQILDNASFILFLNKKDLFEQKIEHSPLVEHFPEYDGLNEMESARNFIRQLFVEHMLDANGIDCGKIGNLNQHRPSWSIRNPRTEPKRIYAHFTNATDTDNIKFVFDSVKHHILQENIDVFFPGAKF